jgi:hypothetical protein
MARKKSLLFITGSVAPLHPAPYLKIIRNATVKTTAIALFDRPFADAGALIEEINLIEEIEDIKTDRQVSRASDVLEFMLHAQVDRIIGSEFHGLGEPGANAVTLRGVGMNRGVEPGVGNILDLFFGWDRAAPWKR